MSRRSFWLSVLVVLVTTGAILVLGPGSWPRVHVVPITRGTLESRFLANGEVRSPTATVLAPGSGRVDQVAVKEQDQVLQGQLLIHLENSQAQHELQDAQSAFWTAQAELNSGRVRLNLSQSQLTQALSQARAEEQRALQDLEGAQKSSPLTGEAQARVAEQRDELAARKAERERQEQFFEQGLIPEREVEGARLQEKVARDRLAQAQARVGQVAQDHARSLKAAQAALARSREKRHQAELALGEVRVQQEDLEGKRKAVGIRSRALDASRSTLSSAIISSPAAGTVWRCLVRVGDQVRQGQPLVRVVTAQDRWVEAWVAEQEASLAKVGQAVTVRSSSNQSCAGNVRLVDPALEHPADMAGSGRYLRIEVAIQDEALRPGTPVEVEGSLSLASEVPLVPRLAVFERQGQSFVAAVDRGRVLYCKVKLGAMTSDKAQLLEGPAPGTLVVVDNPSSLSEGQRLRPQEDK